MKRYIRYFIPPIFYQVDKIMVEIILKLFPKKLYYLLHKEIEKEPLINKYFKKEELVKHYAYAPVRDSYKNPDLYITQIRYYRMFEYFKNNLSDVFDNNIQVLNVGDTSGMLFKAMGRKGISVNINPECIANIKSKEIEAQLGDAQVLKFPDKYFDYSFCFQTLEHLPNPIAALCELGRVTKNKVFVSIPNVRQSKIYSQDYWVKLKKESWQVESVRRVDCHIFEFSEDDFKKILSFTNLKFVDSFPIKYFRNHSAINPIDWFIKRNLDSYFKFFTLEPIEKSI